MEKKYTTKEEIIDVNKFFNLYSNVIQRSNKEKDDPIFIFINLIFNKNTANYFNIVHGGSIAILFENIVHMILFHLTKNIYNTKDINILYKRQVLLNTEYIMEIKVEKIKYKTVFIHCRLYKQQNKEESTEANIISEKEIINKI